MDAPEEDFGALHKRIVDALLSTTRTTSQVCAEDLAFQRSFDPSIATALDRQHARILALAERLLGNAAAGTDLVSPRLSDSDAIDARWRGIVDVVDSLLERADMCLDEYNGVIKRGGQGQEQILPAGSGSRLLRVPRNLDIPKPQRSFEHVPTNDEKDAFKPLLMTKPHAIIPLEQSLSYRERNIQTGTIQYDNRFYISEYKYSPKPIQKLIDSNIRYDHPYKIEIERYSYPQSVYETAEPVMYHPFDATTATIVDTPEALAEMLAELRNASEIAIDLEHHDTRSFVGIVCLMQISTRDRDWIVDTLKPWRRRLECLNEVFVDPKILKVFHGAQSDIVWLQRDFGLYIVGLFDTHHASRALKYKGGSLAFLLDRFISFQAQKQFQTADWRIRPLPREMSEYARSDTHFLLYIYDNMRNELVEASNFDDPEQNLIQHVLELSKATSALRFEHPMYDSVRGMGSLGWYRQLSRTPALFTKEQFAVFRAVHAWRDHIARQEDDNINWIMTNHALFNVAREMPGDRVAMFSIAAPISQPVRLRVDELVGIVSKARAEGSMGPEMHAIMTEIDNYVVSNKADTAASATLPAPSSVAQSRFGNYGTPIVAAAAPVIKRATEALSKSMLWGSVFGSSFWQPKKEKARLDVRLELPLPDLTAQVFENDGMQLDSTPSSTNKTSAKAVSRPEHEYVKGQTRPAPDGLDDVFVVRQLGGKRKRSAAGDDGQAQAGASRAVDDQLAAHADIVDIGAHEDYPKVSHAEKELSKERERQKAEKKAEKKARKEAKKNARRASDGKRARRENEHGVASEAADGEDGEAEDGELEEAFDYASAPSMLNAPRDHAGLWKKGRKYDPYARALGAPKGLGRTQRQREGMSATFKK